MVLLDCPVSMCFIISSETLCKLLSSIDMNKAIVQDGVRNWILHDHALTLPHPICMILYACIRERYLLTLRITAIVISIPNVNPPRIIGKDLRPISLTAVLSKQLELIVGRWMLGSIADRLDMNQYGRLRGLSTTYALVDMVHTWILAA